jgi:hypothetical protein
MVGRCENGNDSLGSVKVGELLDKLSYYQLLYDSAPWSSYSSILVEKLSQITKNLD